MRETYEVEFDYQKEDTEYWTRTKEVVEIFLSDGACEKCSHELAMKKIEKDYPGCKIRKVTYC